MRGDKWWPPKWKTNAEKLPNVAADPQHYRWTLHLAWTTCSIRLRAKHYFVHTQHNSLCAFQSLATVLLIIDSWLVESPNYKITCLLADITILYSWAHSIRSPGKCTILPNFLYSGLKSRRASLWILCFWQTTTNSNFQVVLQNYHSLQFHIWENITCWDPGQTRNHPKCINHICSRVLPHHSSSNLYTESYFKGEL